MGLGMHRVSALSAYCNIYLPVAAPPAAASLPRATLSRAPAGPDRRETSRTLRECGLGSIAAEAPPHSGEFAFRLRGASSFSMIFFSAPYNMELSKLCN